MVFDSTSNLWQKEKIFHVQLENSGNGPDFSGVHELSFGEALYFLMVTMSTVGYGDIVCQTKVGRVFQLLFLGVGLVSFVLLVLSLECFFFRLTTKTTNPQEASANPQKMPPLVFFLEKTLLEIRNIHSEYSCF